MQSEARLGSVGCQGKPVVKNMSTTTEESISSGNVLRRIVSASGFAVDGDETN